MDSQNRGNSAIPVKVPDELLADMYRHEGGLKEATDTIKDLTEELKTFLPEGEIMEDRYPIDLMHTLGPNDLLRVKSIQGIISQAKLDRDYHLAELAGIYKRVNSCLPTNDWYDGFVDNAIDIPVENG